MSVIIPSSGNKYIAPGSKRWTPRQKCLLVEQVLDGEVALQEALSENGLAPDEFSAWVSHFEKSGYAGLRQCKGRSTPSRRRAYGVARAVAILRAVTGAA
jgi:transposase-like protein